MFNKAVFSAHDPSVALVDPDRSASPAHTGLADSDTATRHSPATFFVPTVQIPTHVGQASPTSDPDSASYDCFLPAKSKDLTMLNALPSAPIARLALWNVRNEMDHLAASLASLKAEVRPPPRNDPDNRRRRPQATLSAQLARAADSDLSLASPPLGPMVATLYPP
ncbi:hypothetical protein AX14_014394 [Amanita brunnescens Koide BX004]|nr:hypothetical protein AX14_014394 [Amanita brunnescens Koide BX004]